MKIKLLISRVAIVDNRMRSQQPGDIVDVSKEEAKRLIDKGRAEAVSGSSKQSKPKLKKVSQSEDDT